MAYNNIRKALYEKFCDSIGRDYCEKDDYDFYYKSDTTYNGSSSNVEEFKNNGKDKKAFIEQHKNFYKTIAEDNEVVTKGRNSGFIGLYRIKGTDEHILDEILVSILKAAWEDSEKMSQ